MKKLANLISKIFEPMVVLGIVIMIGAVHSGLREPAITQFAFLFTLGMMVPVGLFRYWIVKKGIVSNWDITRRRERIWPMAGLVCITLIDYGVIRQFHNTFLDHLFFVFILWIVGFFCITLFWKMSGHTGIVALASGFLILWFGWGLWPILLMVPLVGWSRIVRKDHTLAQVIAGALYSWIVLFL